MDKAPDYWSWVYYITRQWHFPDDVEASKIIGFAIITSTFGKNGHEIRPAAHTIARRAGMTDRLASQYRQRCIDLGLFRDTGKRYNCIPVLEISIPGEKQTNDDNPWADVSEPERFECGIPGCNVPVWHEHRTDEPTPQERREAEAEDQPPKHETVVAQARPAADRAWD